MFVESLGLKVRVPWANFQDRQQAPTDANAAKPTTREEIIRDAERYQRHPSGHNVLYLDQHVDVVSAEESLDVFYMWTETSETRVTRGRRTLVAGRQGAGGLSLRGLGSVARRWFRMEDVVASSTRKKAHKLT